MYSARDCARNSNQLRDYAMQSQSHIVLAPTATRIPQSARGRVLVSGSHGGAYAGYLAARAGARAVVLNDAGVGLDPLIDQEPILWEGPLNLAAPRTRSLRVAHVVCAPGGPRPDPA